MGAAPAGQPDPTTMEGAMQLAGSTQNMATEQMGTTELPPVPRAEPQVAPGTMSASFDEIQTKSDEEWSNKVKVTFNRWTEILDRSLERVFERQQRVVLEKATGAKSRKHLDSGALDVESIFSIDTWDKQMDEDIRPVLSAIVNDAQQTYAEKSLIRAPMKKEDVIAHLDAQMSRIKSVNEETSSEISNAIFATLSVRDPEERATALRSAIVTTFTNLLAKKRSQIAEDETRRAWSAGAQI